MMMLVSEYSELWGIVKKVLRVLRPVRGAEVLPILPPSFPCTAGSKATPIPGIPDGYGQHCLRTRYEEERCAHLLG